MQKRTKAQSKRTESQKKYWKTWLEEEHMTILFLLSGGFPRCRVTGSPVTKATSGRLEDTDASIHHIIEVNGNRPSGRANRVGWWKKDLPLLHVVSKKSHDFIHHEDKPKNELLGLNALLTGEIC